MNGSTMRWLVVLLAVQVMLASGSWWPDSVQQEPGGTLLQFAAEQTDRITIGDGSRTVELLKTDGRWTLGRPTLLPADNRQVSALLERLTKLQAGWPVVTNAASHSRLQVSAESFRRRIDLFAEDTSQAALLLGTAPSLRQTHARIVGADEVYAATISATDLAPDPAAWLDAALLAVTTVSAVEHGAYRYERSAEGWSAQALEAPPGPPLSAPYVEALTQYLEQLRVTGISERDLTADRAPALEIDVETPEGTLRFSFSTDGELFFLQRSDYGERFTLSPATYRDIVAAIKPPPGEPRDGEAGERDADDVHQSETA